MQSAVLLCGLLLLLNHLPQFWGQVLDVLFKAQYLEASYQSTELDWRLQSRHFLCISKCITTPQPTTPKPQFIERVFAPSRRMINCYSSKSRFAAEKFCSMHRLIFGMPQDEMSTLLDLLSVKQNVQRKFWSQKLSYDKSSVVNSTNCFYGNRKETDVLADSCNEELNFVCSLPAMCHQDACQMKCSGSNSVYCKESLPERDPLKCFPQCNLVDCSEQFTTVAAANSYCCLKRMKLVSLETRSEIMCLGNEIKKMKIVSKDLKFWTSGSSEKCPKEFGWCGSSELMDYEGLKFSRGSLDSKLCVTASHNPLTSVLSLQEDECSNNKARPMCEAPNHFMCKRSECWKFKCPQERNYYKSCKEACGFEFKLISFETPDKLKCAEELLKTSKMIKNGRYWVSGASFGCFWDNRWCNEDNEPQIAEFKQFPWKEGEPSNVTNKECVAAEYSINKAPHLTFFKAECDTKFKTIVESKIGFNNHI